MDAFIKLLKDDPLYTNLVVEESQKGYEILQMLEHGRLVFDTYCPACWRPTTWRNRRASTPVTDPYKSDWLSSEEHRTLERYLQHIELDCARNAGHKARFGLETSIVALEAAVVKCFTIRKFGQLPALADIAASEIDEYRRKLT